MSELIDNNAHRIRTLKEIIKHLHEGTAPEQAKKRLKELLREVDANEIAAMEQELMAEGMAVEEVQSMCDTHAAVLRDVLVEPKETPLAPGHPVDTFRRENEALNGRLAEMSTLVEAIEALPEDGDAGDRLLRMRAVLNDLMDVEKHYARKENLLFSYLERHGIAGPSKVMWGKDDEVREQLKGLEEALRQTEATLEEWKLVATEVARPAVVALQEMILKEDKILLPMALDTLTEQEWGELWRQSPEYGWCLVEPAEGYAPPEQVGPQSPVEIPSGGDMVFPSGSLDREQLLALFKHLPVDITFVDAQDRVRFFSEGPQRVFARSPAIIGRKVHHCHPPKSVDVVEQILEDFRSGRQSVAEFWIELHGKFVHIRYFAVHGETGDYLGTLEVTQDVTGIRALQGERRLLQYDTATGEA